MKLWWNISGVLGIAALVLAVYAVSEIRHSNSKMAFVNSQQLITGFKPAFEVEKELKGEDDAFNLKLKVLDDSLKIFMDSVTAKYDKADAKLKRQLQDELAARNQQINNLAQAHSKRMEGVRMQKMQGVYDKVNAYMKEFGSKNHYSIIFGTVQGGNILYGEGSAADITQQILDGLNERYK